MNFKQKNIQELIEFTSSRVNKIYKTAYYNGIEIMHPTEYMKTGTIGGTNENDITIHLNGNKHTTYDLSILLFKALGISLAEYHSLIMHIINTDKYTSISFIDDLGNEHEFTLPNFNVWFDENNKNLNENSEDLLISLLMIGVNDNGRYRQYGGDAGMNNHLCTALAAVLFEESNEEREMFANKGINTKGDFLSFLSNGNIFRKTDFQN